MAENRNAQQVREITDRLEQGIKELFESERFKEYLRTMSKFYNYSFNNTLLIAMQKPEATLIAGYTAWQRNFDRHVMKGEKGIRILAPAPYKAKVEMEKIDPKTQKPMLDADGNPITETVEIMRPAFKVVSVFDVSQTEGKELPDIVVDELTGSVENYAAFFEALRQESPVPICALPGFVDSKNEEKTERNAGYLVVSHSGGGMLRQGTRKGIRRTPANRGMRAHRIVKSLDISEDVCHGLCP